MLDFQDINMAPFRTSVKNYDSRAIVPYICVNMSTPLPVRSARLEWTFYFYTYE